MTQSGAPRSGPTLKEKLEAASRARREVAIVAAAYDELIATVMRTGAVASALGEGDQFPDFVLPSVEGRLVTLSSLLVGGPVVVQFFRGEWCPYCRLMLDALAENLEAIEAAGATLIALTPDTGPPALDAKQNHHARFEVLCDVDCGVGLTCGVVFRVPKLYRARLQAAGLDFVERHGNAAWILPVPATYILDRNGMVRWRFIDADFTHRAEPADIIAALQMLAAPG
jgi:peroxiredoxin